MKKIILSIFIFISCFYINICTAYAEEIEEDAVEFIDNSEQESLNFGTIYDSNVVAYNSDSDVSAYGLFNKYTYTDLDFLNVGTYSPAINTYAYSTSNSTKLYYTGNRPLLVYQKKERIYSNGNWFLDSYDKNNNVYLYSSSQYFINESDNVLYMHMGSYTLTISADTLVNCYYYADCNNDEDAANYARNTDLSTNTNVVNYYNVDSTNKFVDDSNVKDNNSIKISDTGVTFDRDSYNAYYIDYLVRVYNSDVCYNVRMYRQYFYDVPSGLTSWNSLESRLYGYMSTWDDILVLGIGTCNVNGTAIDSTAPNQQNLGIENWSYTSFVYDDYSIAESYNNATFAQHVAGTNTITSSTTLKDLQSNSNDSQDKADSNVSNNKIIAFFQNFEKMLNNFTDSIANFLDSIANLFSKLTSLFSKMSDSLSNFTNVLSTTLNWLPEGFLDIVKVAVVAVCAIILIRVIKLFI